MIFPRVVPIFGTCPYCDLLVRVPPGVFFDGEPHHRQCADILREQRYTDQIAQPYFEAIEEALNELVEIDGSTSTCFDV